MDKQKECDVLIWGATSSTGRLVVDYMLRHYGVGGKLRWAIGGRNRDNLKSLHKEFGAAFPGTDKVPVVLADARGTASLEQMLKNTKVVASTVGPYSVYGRELVAVAAKLGVHYCDITGEVDFMHDMIRAHHLEAKRSGARIVHSCGFDSIPSDLGTWVLQEESQRLFGSPCTDVRLFVTQMSGGLGGGTAATIVSMFDRMTPELRRIVGNSYALDPDRTEREAPMARTRSWLRSIQ